MYCTACEEDFPSPQPDGMCLVCGEDLISSPPTNNSNNNNNATTDNGQSSSQSRASSSQRQDGDDDDDDAAATNAMALLASSMENATAINPSALLPLVNQLRGNIPGEQDGGAGLAVVGNNDNVDDDLAGMMLPPDALNPQAGTSASRPTSKAALRNLKRTVLTAQSAELFDAQIRLFEPRSFTDLSPVIGSGVGGCMTLNAVPGEFGPMASSAATLNGNSDNKRQRTSSPSNTAAIVVCSPRTAKGGKLSPQTLAEIATLRQNRMSFVAYVERGDVTFVQKALVCQRAGELETTSNNSNAKSKKSLCIGVIVGNTSSGGGKNEVWPFVMQDTKKEAQKHGLTIPVVMVRREDGTRLVQWAKRKVESADNDAVDLNSKCYTPCQINIHSKEANSHTCPVCTDSFVAGETIVRLECGHVFHESCALAWLTKHNTCPFCRKELPTDDEDYERERRRRENANSGGAAAGEINGHTFYG
mmetsp:Transcript_34696/g.65979  ORF Transcript_34696/g.65979 Transcript_34696/m.65979 type:complete len:475 (-) Transcript_34696:39-1463(-)